MVREGGYFALDSFTLALVGPGSRQQALSVGGVLAAGSTCRHSLSVNRPAPNQNPAIPTLTVLPHQKQPQQQTTRLSKPNTTVHNYRPLLRLRSVERPELVRGVVPLPLDHPSPLPRARGDAHPERPRQRVEPVREREGVDRDLVAVVVLGLGEVEGPEDPGDVDEDRVEREVVAGADAAAPAEGRVAVLARVGRVQVAGEEAGWVEGVRVGELRREARAGQGLCEIWRGSPTVPTSLGLRWMPQRGAMMVEPFGMR